MKADEVRHLYEYHFRANRKLWDECVMLLTQEQFLQPSDYSMGSVRNQLVHLLNIDERWFSGMRGDALPDFLDPQPFENRDEIRAMWDAVEAKMREYLAALTDEMLGKPLTEGDPFPLAQVLLHVANHGTDHRAQVLALLHQLGVKTFPQDYFYFMIGRL
ncbi:MAG: DinB family protein [Chloroflexota bacterium]